MDISCYFELYVMDFTTLWIVFSIVVALQEGVHYQFQFHTKLCAIDVYLFFCYRIPCYCFWSKYHVIRCFLSFRLECLAKVMINEILCFLLCGVQKSSSFDVKGGTSWIKTKWMLVQTVETICKMALKTLF